LSSACPGDVSGTRGECQAGLYVERIAPTARSFVHEPVGLGLRVGAQGGERSTDTLRTLPSVETIMVPFVSVR